MDDNRWLPVQGIPKYLEMSEEFTGHQDGNPSKIQRTRAAADAARGNQS